MPQYLQKHQQKQILQIPGDTMQFLSDWIYTEIEDYSSARKPLEAIWRESLRMYEGVPKLTSRDIPVENAPNIEVTVGAIATDTIYAQAIDLIFNTTPLATVRPVPKLKDDDTVVEQGKALQRFVNWIAGSKDANLRQAAETAILEDIQLGTALIYTPYVQKTKKTKTAKVLSAGPRFYCIPVEDCIVTVGSVDNIEELPLVGIRFYKTLNEIQALASVNKWNIEGIQPIGAKDWVRSERERLGRYSEPGNRKNTLYDLIDVYCFYDIDGDGINEDLKIVWNHSGRKIVSIQYNPMDRRPLEKMVYQLRAHMFYGLGVMQMMAPYEDKLSDVHNFATLNILLANSRVWVGSEGLPETMKMWPGKYIQTPNPSEDLKALEMGDVYSSIWQDQMITMQLANQRVGINDISQPNKIPSRTPGVTATSFLQQVNRRFVPAFDGMRICISNSLSQALYRYQEILLKGGQQGEQAEATIMNILGYDDGMKVITLLKNPSFDEQVTTEITAASASLNREADRQNAVLLTNILAQYYQRTIELVTLAANPETPPEVRDVARKIANSAGEMIDRTIRTFDQMRDPATFIIEMDQELNSLSEGGGDQQAIMQLLGLLGQGGPPPAELTPRLMQ